MNRREADALRQVLATLEHGPGAGWESTIIGRELGPLAPAEQQRILAVDLWIGTWIRPTLRALVDRYWRPSRTNRALTPPVPSTLGRRLRETFDSGAEREARGDEAAPFWVGYFKAVADEAIRRVEELERAEFPS